MPKFTYKLQSVLNLRKQVENAAKNDLAVQLKKLSNAQKQLHMVLTEQEEGFNRLSDEYKEGIQVTRLRQYNYYFNNVAERVKQQKESVKKASKDVDISREKLIKASKEKKILETLREKKYDEFLREQLKAEEKVTDEVVSYRYTK